jgi:ferrous iron transport protein B
MGVIYAVGDDVGIPGAPESRSTATGYPPAAPGASQATLREKIAHDYSPLQGLCMMLLVLIATPCVATLAITARESGAWKWAALQWSYLTALAWLVATATYQVGHTLGMG